jgi:Methyltransferase domain
VRLHFIDHLITGGNYSTTITLAYTEAVRAAGPAMLDICFIFLVGDYIVADGSFAHIIGRMLAGRSGMLVGNFQVIEEDATPWLQAQIDASPDVLALSPRHLVGWGLWHLHPATVANTVNFGVIRNAHTNRLFWRVDSRTLIGRFFLMHMICIRPETTDFVIGSACDYSFVPEMCPSGNIEIVVDSDQYLVIEMQPQAHEKDFLRAGTHHPSWLANSLSEWTTERHRRNANTTVVFHAGAIPDSLSATVAAADTFLDQVRTRLDPVPKPHRDHPYWKGAIATFREATGSGLTPDEKLFSLGYIQFYGRSVALRRRIGRLVAQVIGQSPQVTRWHPRWADYKLLLEALQRHSGDTPTATNLLLVSEVATFITTGFPDGGERIHRMRTSRLLASSDARLVPLHQRFDICFVEVFETDVALVERIVERVELLMRDGGRLIVSVIPRYTTNLRRLNDNLTSQLARLMRPSARTLEFEFVPLNVLRRRMLAGLSYLHALVRTSPRLGFAVAAITGPPLLTLGWLGNWTTRAQRGQVRGRPISSALVTIVIDSERARESHQFQRSSFDGTKRMRRDGGGQPSRRAFATPTDPRRESAPVFTDATALSSASTGNIDMLQSHSDDGAETREPQYNRCLDIKAQQGLTPLGLMTNQVWEDDPRRLTFLLSRYKFVSKMLSGRKFVGELGCGDAFGTRVVMQEVERVVAYDFDPVFVEDIRSRRSERWPVEAYVHDILQGRLPNLHDAIYSLDVIEHIRAADEDTYICNLRDSLTDTGVLIIGSPSLESQDYASPPSKEGHVNCKSGGELKALLGHYFHTVFLFSMNDEVVHTGFAPMAHYLFAVCCQKKPPAEKQQISE